MIITLRNQIKHAAFRYVAFFIFAVLCISMVSIPTLMRQESAASWALKVNGQQVSFQDFAQEIAQQSEFLAQVRAQYGQYADLLFQAMGWPTNPKALAFEVLIKAALMNQLVEKMGIAIHADYIIESTNDAQFARRHLQKLLPAFVFDQTGSLDSEKLGLYLKHKGMSIKDFEIKVEQSLAQLQALQFIGTSLYVPTFDIEQEFIGQKLGKQFEYLIFSFDSFLAAEKKRPVSVQEAQTFYDTQNIQYRRYWVPEKRDGVVWKFNAHNYNISISEEQINEYYEDNKVSKYVVDPIKLHVQQITEKQLEQSDGITLDAVREDILNNPSSSWAQKWETVEPFARGEKKGEYEREAFLLKNEGDISSVIDTNNGKVIIKLVKRAPRTYKPLSAVKNEIKNILAEKQFKKGFIKDLKTVVVADNTQSIESLIAQKGGKKEMALGIIKNDTRLSQELFGLRKNEYAVFIEGDNGFVVMLTAIAERNLPEFDTIKDVVIDDFRDDRAYKAMINAVENAQKAAEQSSFDALARDFNATVHRTDMIRPNDTKNVQELDKKNLPTKAMLSLDKVGSLMAYNADGASFLIKVSAIEDYDQNSLESGKKEVEAMVSNNRIKAQIESVVASLHRNATIETNESTQIAGEDYSE